MKNSIKRAQKQNLFCVLPRVRILSKRIFFILTAFLLLSIGANAQRYLPGQHVIQITAGTVNGLRLDEKYEHFGAHAGLAFSTYTKNGNRWVFGG